jgi:glycosyltransferase involved in cell wall biosynthesis
VPKVSVTIITLDEAEHIAAAIASAAWADEIVVVDAGSRDDTVAIARANGARVEVRGWPGWIEQKNYAASMAAHDWILSLDADERITPALAAEVRALLAADPPRRAYRVPRVTFHLGRWIRTTDFYPDYQTRLYDRRAARGGGTRVHE